MFNLKLENNNLTINNLSLNERDSIVIDKFTVFFLKERMKEKCDCCNNYSNKEMFSLFIDKNEIKTNIKVCFNCLNNNTLKIEKITRNNFLNPKIYIN